MDRNDAMQVVVVVMNAVALRKESVDRNSTVSASMRAFIRSLSARRAWIEIPLKSGLQPLTAVALRKESVDRNALS